MIIIGLCDVNPPVLSDDIVGHLSVYVLRLSRDGPSTSSWCHLGGSCEHLCLQLSANRRQMFHVLDAALFFSTSAY